MAQFELLRSWSLETAMAMARVRRMTKMMRLTGLMKESIWRRSAERSHIKAYLTHTCRLCYAYTMYKHKHTGSHTHIHTHTHTHTHIHLGVVFVPNPVHSDKSCAVCSMESDLVYRGNLSWRPRWPWRASMVRTDRKSQVRKCLSFCSDDS